MSFWILEGFESKIWSKHPSGRRHSCEPRRREVLRVGVGGAHFVSMGTLLEFSPPQGAADQMAHIAFIPSCNRCLSLLFEL